MRCGPKGVSWPPAIMQDRKEEASAAAFLSEIKSALALALPAPDLNRASCSIKCEILFPTSFISRSFLAKRSPLRSNRRSLVSIQMDGSVNHHTGQVLCSNRTCSLLKRRAWVLIRIRQEDFLTSASQQHTYHLDTDTRRRERGTEKFIKASHIHRSGEIQRKRGWRGKIEEDEKREELQMAI